MYGCLIRHDFPFAFPPSATTPCRTVRFRHSPKPLISTLPCRTVTFQPTQGRNWHLEHRSMPTPFFRDHWHLHIEGLGSFYWHRHGTTIRYRLADPQAPEAALHYWIIRILLPLYLHLVYDYIVLHAASYLIDGKARLLLAPAGWGKSEYIRRLDRLGVPILSDDVTVIERRGACYRVFPSYPYTRRGREPETLGEPLRHFYRLTSPLVGLYTPCYNNEIPCSVRRLTGVRKYRVLEKAREFRLPWREEKQIGEWMDFIRSVDLWQMPLTLGSSS